MSCTNSDPSKNAIDQASSVNATMCECGHKCLGDRTEDPLRLGDFGCFVFGVSGLAGAL